ncbi:MbtH family protein [Tumebacillus algifaecis]|uniref:MbtH family protein n=1 Tax=Tumebacillus algifaecis TaxID=1214604 RepID=A0A223D2L3_9BACL|nr:MbtH family protein [Tumebacillus algifaecis]ASS75852.1 MbtH family protein [Tumebacillus algifaecis]
MINPFEMTNGIYLVLKNEEGQYSLWPAFAFIPDGWDVVYGQASKEACLDFINSNWSDLRPTSLNRSEGAAAGEKR